MVAEEQARIILREATKMDQGVSDSKLNSIRVSATWGKSAVQMRVAVLLVPLCCFFRAREAVLATMMVGACQARSLTSTLCTMLP